MRGHFSQWPPRGRGVTAESQGWCTIVVPCYNESARLNTDIFAEFLRQGHKIRFLFVNDGSKDDTARVIQRFSAGREEYVELLDKQKNAGKAEAVREGMLTALREHKAEYVGFWDADLATPLDAIPDLLRELAHNSALQMIFGARVRLLGRDVHRKAIRHYLGRLFATVVSVMLRLPIYDTQCGAKIFRATPQFEAILTEPFISRWVFDVEIIARVLRANGFNVKEVEHQIYEFPLKKWEDVAGSKVHGGDFLKASVDIIRIYRKYLA